MVITYYYCKLIISGCSAARLAHHVRDVEVGCSNHLTPTLLAEALFQSEGELLLINSLFKQRINRHPRNYRKENHRYGKSGE